MRPEASVCGTLVDPLDGVAEGCVNVRDGLIDSVSREPRGEEVYRAPSGSYIAPGLIDLHVHLRGLELSYKEDEATGTMAALSSGITLVADMPNTRPRLATPEAVSAKLRALAAMSYTDYAVYAGIPDRPDGVDALRSMPVVGFKVYPEDLGARAVSVRRVLDLKGTLVVLHPEVPEAERVWADENYERGLARGCWMEAASLYMLSGARARVHVTHVSCPSTLLLAKSMGFTADTTPHYMFYSYYMSGCQYRVNPPLRDEVSRSLIVKYVLEGTFDALGSDHAPHSRQEKAAWPHCPPGIPWLGLWPWVVYRLVKAHAMSRQEFLRLTSLGPAKVLGLDRLYGRLRPGYRANLVVIDEAHEWRFTGTYSKAPYCHAFMSLAAAAPLAVFVGGQLASEGFDVKIKPRTVNPVEVSRLG